MDVYSQYVLEALSDVQNKNCRKTWFYFKVQASRGIKAKFVLQNVRIYDSVFQVFFVSNQDKLYCKPMMKEGKYGTWQESTDSFFSVLLNLYSIKMI